MLYQIAYLCETAGNNRGVWIWVTGPISDPIDTEAALTYFMNRFHSDLIDYASGKTVEELQAWLREKNKDFYEQNTPTKRASLPEESGPGGDKDMPYVFTLPTSWGEQEAWLRLANKYRNGKVQS